MKFKTLIVVSAIACFSTLTAQNPLYYDGKTPIEYDFFGSDKLPLTLYLKKDIGVNFRIYNFNKNLYTININNTDKTLFSEVPPIFKVLTDIDDSKLTNALQGDGASNALADDVTFENKVSIDLAQARVTYVDKTNKVGALIDTYMKDYKKLKRANQIYKDLERILNDDCRKFVDLKNDKIELTYIFLTQHYAYKGNKDETSMSVFLQTETSNLIINLDNQYNEITKYYNFQKLFRPQFDEIMVKEIKKPISKKVPDEITAYQKVTKNINDILDETINEVKVAKTVIDTYIQDNFPANLKKMFDRINESNFVYISPIFKAKGDLMTIKFTVDAKSNTLTCSEHRERLNGVEIEGKVTGFKMNFSSGLFGIMGDEVFDQSYRLENIEGDTQNNKIVKNDNKSRIAPAIGALMHFYNKRNGAFSWGGAFGLSVNNETNLNYHGGLSALFGEEQRIIISAGATLVNVELLSNEYTVGGNIPKSITTIPTDKFYRWGTFISLTYNLAKL